MKKILPLIALSHFLITFAFAQKPIRKCITHEKVQQKISEDAKIAIKRNEIERFTKNWNAGKESDRKQTAILTIPVVIHVVYRNNAENISDAQIASQMKVLNDDYRRLNIDTSVTPSAFKSLAADCEIEFCLASKDPNGNATTGITRTSTTVNNIGNTSKYYSTANGGHDIWNPNKYLNIWVCNIDGGSTLGFAWPPGTSSTLDDGAVIDYRFFGTIGLSPPFHLGRTVTHEVGHYLNLEHIWGDDWDDCSMDDGVSDTPKQATSTFDCPNFPITNDQCSPGVPGIMFMNYMDYSDDSCMNIFTKGQKQRMISALNGPRSSLLTSDGCDFVNNVNIWRMDVVKNLYPNPSNGLLTIELNSNIIDEVNIEVCNVLGKVVYQSGKIKYQDKFNLDVSKQPNGLYFVKVLTDKGTFVRKVVVNSDVR